MNIKKTAIMSMQLW